MGDTAAEERPAVASYGDNPPAGGDQLSERPEQVRTAAQSTILVGELHHRLQNTLAIVLALSRLTARSVTTLEEFQVAFGKRIEAMSRTNALLLQGEVQAVSVRTALEAELLPYLADEGQVTLTCAAVKVSPDAALKLSLIFHELATNAAKYGALSEPSGRLTVTCTADALVGHLHWQEFVTTPLEPASRYGSGSLLIARLARSLGGTARVNLLSGGLEAIITFKLGEA